MMDMCTHVTKECPVLTHMFAHTDELHMLFLITVVLGMPHRVSTPIDDHQCLETTPHMAEVCPSNTTKPGVGQTHSGSVPSQNTV